MDWRQHEPPSAVTKRVGTRAASRPIWDQMNPSPLVLGVVPDGLGYLADEGELSPLVLLGHGVALLGGGEATLRGEAQALERHDLGGLGDALADAQLDDFDELL